MKTLRGFSTLEILIAMSVMFLVLGAVILVSFGNQTAIADSQTDAEALNFAQRLLEGELADARKDFNLVNSFASSTSDGFYTAQTTSELSSDYLTKKVTVKVSWKGDHLRVQNVSLVGLITNFTGAVGANTCNSTPEGDWKNPTLASSYDLATLVGDAGGTYPITDVDAYQGKLYVTTSNPSGPVKPNFFIFSIVNPNSASPSLSFISGRDTDPTNITGSGVNAVTVATNSAGSYAYLANASSPSTVQLQVLNLTTSAITNMKVPGLTSGSGNSIAYRDGYIFLGLNSTTGQGKEFNIVDVHTPTSPFVRSSANIGNGVNAIFVKGLYAYVASPNSQSLKVFDISNPNGVTAVGGYTGIGNTGKSVYAVGDTVYLGTTASGAHLHILDASTPASLSSLGSATFSASVDGIIVRDSLAFVLTKSALQVINATSTAAWSSAATLPSSGSTLYEPVMDCEGNMIFVGSNDSGDHGKLYVYVPKP